MTIGVEPTVDTGSPAILLRQRKEGGICIIDEPAALIFLFVPEVSRDGAANLFDVAAQE